MTAKAPGWLIALLAVQLLIAALFGLFGWSQTVSLAQGRPASLLDLAGLAMPVVAVVVLGGASVRLWRAGNRQLAIICALLPFPLSIAVFMALGAI